jgi:hypothetical protein
VANSTVPLGVIISDAPTATAASAADAPSGSPAVAFPVAPARVIASPVAPATGMGESNTSTLGGPGAKPLPPPAIRRY